MDKYLKLSKYYSYQIYKSPILLIGLGGFVVIPIATILMCYFFNSKNLYYSSFIIAIVFQLYVFIWLMLFSIKLFNENKYNLSDIKLLGKNYHRIDLFLTKCVLILLIFIICNLIMLITSSVLLAVLKQSAEVILATIFSNFFGLLINLLFMLPIFIIISTYINRIWSPIVSLLVVILLSFSSIVANVFLTSTNQNNNLQININNQDAVVTYNKIYKFDENNSYLGSTNVYSINYLSDSNINNNLDFNNNINYMNKFSSLIPGNLTLSAQQAIYSSIIRDTTDLISDYNKNKTSLVKLQSNNFQNVSSFLDKGCNYVLTNIIDENIFNLSENDLKKLVVDNLHKTINDNSEFKDIIDNEIELNSISNALFLNEIWNTSNLNKNQFNFIFELLGKSVSCYFYLWYYNDVFMANTGNLFDYIAKVFNNEPFANFIKTLWSSYSTYLNVILLDNNDEISSFRTLLSKQYPINFSYNANLYPSNNDLNFFKQGLVIFKNDSIFVLNNNSIYEQVNNNDFYDTFSSDIIDQNAWINYIVNENIPTVAFLKEIYSKISSFYSNIYDYEFSNQNFNLQSFDSTFEINTTPYIQLWPLWLSGELLLIFILFYCAWIFYRRSMLN